MAWFWKKKPVPKRRPIRWCDKCGYQQWAKSVDGSKVPFIIKYIASKDRLRFECPRCGHWEFEPTYEQRVEAAK